MSSECLGCGTLLDNEAVRCPQCRMSVPLNADRASEPIRKRLSIPFAIIVGLGFAWALMIGGGKPGNAHPVAGNFSVGAAVNGKPVQIGGPAIALLERKLASGNARDGNGHLAASK